MDTSNLPRDEQRKINLIVTLFGVFMAVIMGLSMLNQMDQQAAYSEAREKFCADNIAICEAQRAEQKIKDDETRAKFWWTILLAAS
jgi:hypothetical protein